VIEAKATFESISSIHIYSLQPNTLQDLNVLLEVGREIVSSFGDEDPLELGKQWGMIQNEQVKVFYR
jgi:DNA polymerase delta subunit 3